MSPQCIHYSFLRGCFSLCLPVGGPQYPLYPAEATPSLCSSVLDPQTPLGSLGGHTWPLLHRGNSSVSTVGSWRGHTGLCFPPASNKAQSRSVLESLLSMVARAQLPVPLPRLSSLDPGNSPITQSKHDISLSHVGVPGQSPPHCAVIACIIAGGPARNTCVLTHHTKIDFFCSVLYCTT